MNFSNIFSVVFLHSLSAFILNFYSWVCDHVFVYVCAYLIAGIHYSVQCTVTYSVRSEDNIQELVLSFHCRFWGLKSASEAFMGLYILPALGIFS